MLEKFLSQLGAGTRITVGVSVSPNIGLEMIEIDKSTGIVNKYSFRPLEYNNSTREIDNYEDFKEALLELFDELDIAKNNNIVLSIPNVYFGMINLPLLLTDDAITNAIISEVEQSYIFKRQEPLVSWSDVSNGASTENRLIAYTAVQKQSVDQIMQICEEVGCTLTCVESSFASLFRALNYLDIAKDQMQEGVSWNLMVIMQNNYSIISMNGKKAIEYYEEPLALKSFIDDEIYNAIRTSAQLTLAGLPANYLFIVSETDLVSAEVLSMKMPFEGTIKFLESNKFVQNEIMPIDLNILPNKASMITIEAIGSAIYQFSEFPLKLNVLNTGDGESLLTEGVGECPKINIGNLEVELTPKFIKKISVLLSTIILIPALAVLLFVTQVIKPKEDAQLSELDSKIESLNSEIKRYQDLNKNDTFDVKNVSNGIITNNKNKLTYYSALGLSVLNKLWIDYYETNSAGRVYIEGVATDVKSVYAFYKNIKQMVNDSDIKLRKLEVSSGSIDDIVQNNSSFTKVYMFEITNMTDGDFSSASATPAKPGEENKDKPQDGKTDTNSIVMPTDRKSLFKFGQINENSTDVNKGNADGGNEQAKPEGQSGNQGEALPRNLKKIEKF